MCSSKPKPPPPPPPPQPPALPPTAPEINIGAETGGTSKRKKVSRSSLRSPAQKDSSPSSGLGS